MTTVHWGGKDLLEIEACASRGNLWWHTFFLGLAEHASTASKDPSRKCGAVIVRPNKTIASFGFNGFARGCDDSPQLYANRDKKLSRVIHAEMNAILNCVEHPSGYTMYVWAPGACPSCDRCAAHVIQSGISRVVYLADHEAVAGPWSASIDSALEMYHEANIEILAI